LGNRKKNKKMLDSIQGNDYNEFNLERFEVFILLSSIYVKCEDGDIPEQPSAYREPMFGANRSGTVFGLTPELQC